MTDTSQLEHQKKRAADFINAELSAIADRRFEADTFEPAIEKHFTVRGPDGPGPEITLTKLKRHAKIESERKMLRTQPFTLVFTGPLEPLLPDQTYRLTQTDDPEQTFLLFLKPFDQWPEEGKTLYESVIN